MLCRYTIITIFAIHNEINVVASIFVASLRKS